MASVEGGPGAPTGKSRLGFLSGLGRSLNDTWLGRNWQTVAILVLLVLLAFFVRSYFVLGTSIDNGYLVSGGSDSYYHERVIDYVTQTGQHLYRDPLLNYPWDMRNPRPPLFDWSVAVTGMTLAGISGGDVSDGTGFVLVTATAFWGALTIIPVYMIGRQAFGRKVGLVASFLFALMPGHIERSVATQADHDAMVLFFVVLGFYFLLMSLKSISGNKWVSSWRDRKAILSGISAYLRMNQVSLIYAALGGVSVAAVAFIWTGFTYVLIIVLVYFLAQVLINRFRNIDTMGVMMSVGVMLGLAFILIGPLYWVMDYWNNWFDVPLLLFLAMMVVGGIFVMTRDLPWTLVIPSFVIFVIAALAVVFYIAPNLFDAIITGQGYLVKSKLYSTISEAQSPTFSTLAMSFGIVTFWLSLVGIGYAMIKMVKNLSAYFVFLVIWTATAVFMAASAGRFLFNAAPAFAIMAAWILVLIVDMVRFQDYPRGLSGAKPWKAPFAWFRGAFPVKYLMAVFFVLMLVVVPNAWAAVDASIPSEDKAKYDLQVYNAMPKEIRPEGYDSVNGSNWYLGAFGYSLPLPSQYYPAAWRWYSTQDAELPITERPAFLSWWDYGFEAIQAGKHPTVADNFQNGYQFAGNYLTCTDEAQAVAMLITRCIEYRDLSEGSALSQAMSAFGVDTAKVRDIMTNPSQYISTVLANPSVYGNFSDDLSAANAKYIASRVEIAKIGEEQCASLYHEIREVTGDDIGYIAVDSRLFPFSATGYNIFYAPAKLSDHVISDVSNSPVDFYTIYATVYTSSGATETIPLEEVVPSMTVVSYSIQYTQAFYQTMLYRAFMGFGPYDIGYTEQGIPGFSGSLQSLEPMQAWNQTHFRVVYKTAYYNPYPSEMVANHTDAWMAISYEEALELQQKIQAGEATGVVDYSAYGLASGVVFVQYYDGAIIEGQVTAESGMPYPDVWVTVQDEYGIPHGCVKTDSEGRYSLIVPFGDLKVIYSTGTLDQRTLVADSQLSTWSLTVTYDQAMRRTDYTIDGDKVLTTYDLEGQVYWDMDADGSYSSDADSLVSDAIIVVENETIGFRAEVDVESGNYRIDDVPGLNTRVYAVVGGHPTTPKVIQIDTMADTTVDIAIVPASISGAVQYPDGTSAVGLQVELLDKTNGTTMSIVTNASGGFRFDRLIDGEYELRSAASTTTFGPQAFELTGGEAVNVTLTVWDEMTLSGQARLYTGALAKNATIAIYNDGTSVVTRADGEGRYVLALPAGEYSLYVTTSLNAGDYAVLKKVSGISGSVVYNPVLYQAGYAMGSVTGASDLDGLSVRLQSRTNGAVYNAVTNATGNFRALLPNDIYFVHIGQGGGAYWGDVALTGSEPVALQLVSSATISGVVWYDEDGDSTQDVEEGLVGIPVTISDADGRSTTILTTTGGGYEAQLVPGKNYVLEIERAGYSSYSHAYKPTAGTITQDVQMIALERTVTGTVTYGGATIPGITVTFQAAGQGAITLNTTTAAGGLFTVQLHPGVYDVIVDQEIVAGDNASKYQYDAELTVQVGKDPEDLSIALSKRFLVNGTITPYRGAVATVIFSGPDSEQLQANNSFTTYLKEGEYSVYVLIERLGSRWATLTNSTILAGTNTVVLTNELAYLVQGSIEHNGAAVKGPAPVTIAHSTGGSKSATTTVAGSFSAYLPAGSYTVTVDHRTLDSVLAEERYVRYTGSLDFSVSSARSVIVPVEQQLDNSTLSGHVRLNGKNVAATLEFMPSSATAIWTNASATASGFASAIAPGNYSIYAKQISGPAVYMGALDLPPYGDTAIDIDLVAGVRYSGVTQLAGEPGRAWLEFSSEGIKALQSSVDGRFEIYLPAGTYEVEATSEGSERGVAVQYQTGYEIDLRSSQSATVDLAKVPDYGVGLEWDSSEKRTVEAGQSVSYNLRVVNTGNTQNTITLSTRTLPSGWSVSFSENPVTLDFGPSNSQLVTATLSTPSDAKVSHSAVTVYGQSVDASSIGSVALDVGIRPRYSVSLALVEAQETNGSEYRYDMGLTNTGNTDDTYDFGISNLAEVEGLGWSAQVRLGDGQWSDSLTTTLTSGGQTIFELLLVPMRETPASQVTVVLSAVSGNSTDAAAVLEFAPHLPDFNIPGGISVSGEGVSTSAPQLPTMTLALIGLLLAVATVLILVMLQRGVLKRRKR